MKYRIPFNRPYFCGSEFDFMREAIANMHVSGNGPFTERCQTELERLVGVKKALLTTSCTHALEMAALLLDVKFGDEVIFPAFTFVSTVNAFVLRGVRPVFADIRPDTLNLDEAMIERLITERTKAVVPVHYAGVSCEMTSILDIARRHEIAVVEDNAHGLFGTYKGRQLGTFGCLATQSFHETKNVHCGEGGALLINDAKYCDRAEIIREKGTDRSRFLRGQVDKYSWVDVGSSYVPSDLLAAVLWGQLQARESIQEKRRRIWHFYHDDLKEWADEHHVTLPNVPSNCEQSYHMFYILMPNLELRSALINHLNSRLINSVFHYLPLHISKMGRRFGGKLGDCRVTERVSNQLLRLPFYNDMTQAEQAEVVAAVKQFSWGKTAVAT